MTIVHIFTKGTSKNWHRTDRSKKKDFKVIKRDLKDKKYTVENITPEKRHGNTWCLTSSRRPNKPKKLKATFPE